MGEGLGLGEGLARLLGQLTPAPPSGCPLRAVGWLGLVTVGGSGHHSVPAHSEVHGGPAVLSCRLCRVLSQRLCLWPPGPATRRQCLQWGPQVSLAWENAVRKGPLNLVPNEKEGRGLGKGEGRVFPARFKLVP